MMTAAAAAAAETATKTAKAKREGSCGGDGCDVRDAWPLYRVHQLGVSCRLCAACVLKYHPESFCTLCLDILDAGSLSNPLLPPAAAPAIVHCAKCPSVSHLACLPNPDLASQFVCPSCKNPERFSYFLREKMDGSESAMIICLAGRLSAKSIKKEAVGLRAEAEEKAKTAAMKRKNARAMLEEAMCKEKEMNQRNAVGGAPAVSAVAPKPAVTAAVEEPKRKWGKVGPASGGGEQQQKRMQSREIEKWMRFHEPLPDMMGQGKGEKDKSKVGAPAEVTGRAPASLGQEEKDKKGSLSGSQSGRGSKEEGRSLIGSGEKGPRLPQATQDVLVSRTNSRPIFTGSPSTASLRS